MKRSTGVGLLTLLTMLALATPGDARVREFAVTYLGHLGGGWSGSNDVNNLGDVVGLSGTPTGEVHAFLWTSTALMTDLGTLGGTYSVAEGVNDARQVVGQSTTTAGDDHAFLWQAGTMLDLGTLGGDTSWAGATNSDGQVVGFSETTPVGPVHAFLWENGVMQDLGTLGGNHSYAYDVNDSGQVVGRAFFGPGGADYHAFLWEDGVIQDLGTLGNESAAYLINNRGQVVGSSRMPDGDWHVFMWEAGTMTDLGELWGGGLGHQLRGINDRGAFVGIAAQGYDYEAFLWWRKTLLDVEDLITGAPNCDLSADGINRTFRIAGSCYDPLTFTSEAVLLTPMR